LEGYIGALPSLPGMDGARVLFTTPSFLREMAHIPAPITHTSESLLTFTVIISCPGNCVRSANGDGGTTVLPQGGKGGPTTPLLPPGPYWRDVAQSAITMVIHRGLFAPHIIHYSSNEYNFLQELLQGN